MEYRKKHGICYVSLGGAFPAGAVPVRHPSAPLVILIRRDPHYSRGFWAIDDLGQLTEPEGPAALLPQPTPADAPQDLQDFVKGHGAAVLNTAFPRGYEFAETWFAPRPTRLRLRSRRRPRPPRMRSDSRRGSGRLSAIREHEHKLRDRPEERRRRDAPSRRQVPMS